MAKTNNRFIKINGTFSRENQGESMEPSGVTAPNLPQTSTNPFMSGDYSNIQDPADAMNILVFDLLKRAQGVDTTELLKRKRELQRAVLGQEQKSDVSKISTLSPEQQDTIRSGNIGALQPEIDENAYQIAKADKAIENFERVYTEAKQFGEDFAEKMVAPDSIIDSYVKKIEENPEMLSTLLSTVNEKTKQAVIQKLDYSKLKTPAERKTAVVEGKLIDTQTGEVVYGDEGGESVEIRKQNELDAQTVNSAYLTIQNIAKTVGKTPETLTEADVAKFSNQDADTISKALARMQNPDIARQGGDPGSALEATSFKGKVKQYSRGVLEGKKYLPSEILDAIKTANALVRGSSTNGVSGTFPVIAPNGVTYNFSTQAAADEFRRQAGIQ